jgi:hypothetical protein
MSSSLYAFCVGIEYAIVYEDGLFIYHCSTSVPMPVVRKEEGIDEVMMMK